MRNCAQKLSMLLVIVSLQALSSVAAPAAGRPQPSEPTTLYKATFVRAAPGKLLDLVALRVTPPEGARVSSRIKDGHAAFI